MEKMPLIVKKYEKAKPYIAVIFLQFGFAGMSIICKSALNQGMSPHVLVVYRHIVATILIAPFAIFFERKARPKMTISIFIKIVLLGLLEPTIDQNLTYMGMKYTTATFTTALFNVVPAFAFLMAWISKLEKVNIRRLHSQAKLLGTIVTVGGAMVMTLVKGPMIELPWIKLNNDHHHQTINTVAKQNPVKGALFIMIGCFSWSAFIILQAITLKAYPAELSLAALICMMGAVEGTIVAIAIEGHNSPVWVIHLDVKLLAVVYTGVVCSGLAYYLQGIVMKRKGPVFVTAFSPLAMVIVAIIGSFVLAEILYLGSVFGALFIVAGLYLVLWGKSGDKEASSLGIENKTSSSPTTQQLDIETTRTTFNQDFVALDVTQIARIQK